MNTTTIFRGGPVRTLDPANPSPEALAIGGGRVLASGDLAAVRAAAPGAEEVDLAGGCVVPGFIDAHHHFVLSALLAERPDARAARSHAEVLEAVRAALAAPGDGWVVVHGVEPARLAEDAFPSQAALDALAGERPVAVLAFSLHEAAVNAAGLARLGGAEAFAQDPKAVLLDRRGAPTGEIREHAVARVLQQLVAERVARDEAGAVLALERYAARLAALGLVHVLDPGLGPTEERLLRAARAGGRLAVEVDHMLAAETGLFRPAVDRLESGGGSRQIKAFVDGGAMVAMSWSAAEILRYSLALPGRALAERSLRLIRRALREDVLPGPDRRYHGGIRNFTRETLAAFCDRAFDRGYSVALHASGTEAIDMALEALALRGDRPAPVPDQIVHFLFPGPGHVERAAALGVAVVLQPAMVEAHAHEVERSMPRGAFELAPPLAEMRARGVFMVLSSDAPIAECAPLAILAAALHPARGEGLPPEVALAQLTREAARALGRPDKGALAPGQVADLVVLDRDPLAPGCDLAQTRVLATYAAGRRVA